MKSTAIGLLAAGLLVATNGMAADKKIVFIAGPQSHGPGEHEHRAGCLLLSACLASKANVTSVVYSNGWPTEAGALDDAAAIVIYSDGGGGHPFLKADRLKTIDALMDKGVGLVAIHYAVEPTKEKGQKEWLDWIGGAFEIHWSVNPHWDADFKTLPKHPITKGVNPFKIRDEWYYNMRFRDDMKGVTAILSAIPDASTTNREDGPHSGNSTVRGIVARGEPVTVAWAATRPNGGRGFGFTGAHFHRNWANDDFRKLVLNAIVWAAKAGVPRDGVESHVTEEQMKANLDPKGKK
jgi:type 1 glutamine amidotransferase